MDRALSFDLESDGLLLSLSPLCIEGAAREAHREVVAALFSGREEVRVLAPAAELLENFLTHTGFPALRARHPELNGGQALRVRLYRDETGAVRWKRASSP